MKWFDDVGSGHVRAFLVYSVISLAFLSANLADVKAQECSDLSLSLSATPASGSAPLTVRFDASLEGHWAAPIEYDWWFGDGTSKTFPNSGNPTEWHTYGSWTEPYKVFVSVKDSRGCWRQTFVTLIVTPASPLTDAWLFAVGAVIVLAIAILLFSLRTRVLHVERRCTSCGFTNPSYVKSFCVSCGRPLESKPIRA